MHTGKLVGFGFFSDWLRKMVRVLNKVVSVIMQNQSKCKLLLTLK